MVEDPRGSSSKAPRGAAAAVLTALGQSGPSSRADIATKTGLPLTTVSSAVVRLIEEGRIRELKRTGPGAGRGRPTTMLMLAAEEKPVLVALLSHDHLEVAVVGPGGEIGGRTRVPFAPVTVDDIVEPVADELDKVRHNLGIATDDLRAAVIGLPASYESGRGVPLILDGPGGTSVSASSAPGWMLHDQTAEFTRRLGMPVTLENDANLGALGEATFGAGQGAESLLHLKVLPGIGAGLVIDGRLRRGAHGLLGELAHLQADPGGPLCFCGNRGCLLTIADAHAIAERLRPAYAVDLSVDEIIARSADGDRGIVRIIGDLGRTIGRFLATGALFLDPEVVIVDGSLAGACRPFIDGLRESMERALPAALAERIRIVPGELAERAEFLGALALAQRSLFQR